MEITTSNFKIKTSKLILLLMLITCWAQAQTEAGDINWKKWQIDIPVNGKSKIIEGKAIKKALSSGAYNDYFKQNSNKTIELISGQKLRSNTGDAESRGFSSSELVEIYHSKSNDYSSYWTNSGTHVLSARLKAYKAEGSPETYLARILSADKSGTFDKMRLIWDNGILSVEYIDGAPADRRYSKKQIGKVDENMFTLTVKMISGDLSLSIKCKKAGLDIKNMLVANYVNTEYSHNLFRIGNCFNYSKSIDDGVKVQLKYVQLMHKK
ncbi:polysaccharide lyase family 7 protein [Neotamlana laminarinivorans]|uniref:Alginate lyase 2 domain-containing protein n=1 Tax=Neotamlana laminarinivorans TaxID=2883124 RepID=A0A9X1HYU0_9FLAO|nr:polysaccharide lyase family 7 protein [Tamlana laminarinivorans]MCB4798415.1 hypothetical protein [Tamlana laminarinivorans]